jgi:phage repressor protein C with HTH and peptisase S24 domain/DNA-binding XRE family transcriptional regulator
MEPLGDRIRRQRRRLGLTLDELAGRTGISKPYLSLIETGRVPNPPSDEKLTRIERSLGFHAGELLSQAHLIRTPRDIRVMLTRLLGQKGQPSDASVPSTAALIGSATTATASIGSTSADESSMRPADIAERGPDHRADRISDTPAISLDRAYLSGVLQQLVERSATNVETLPTHAVPVINRISAGYPRDFTDLSYPRGVADSYVSCPDLADPDAFAARVHGDSMTPKYREGDIVIFSPKANVRSGDDAFVRFEDGQTTFKRVFFEADENQLPVIRLQPRNERYRPQSVPAESISGLYRAMYRYQSVDED